MCARASERALRSLESRPARKWGKHLLACESGGRIWLCGRRRDGERDDSSDEGKRMRIEIVWNFGVGEVQVEGW